MATSQSEKDTVPIWIGSNYVPSKQGSFLGQSDVFVHHEPRASFQTTCTSSYQPSQLLVRRKGLDVFEKDSGLMFQPVSADSPPKQEISAANRRRMSVSSEGGNNFLGHSSPVPEFMNDGSALSRRMKARMEEKMASGSLSREPSPSRALSVTSKPPSPSSVPSRASPSLQPKASSRPFYITQTSSVSNSSDGSSLPTSSPQPINATIRGIRLRSESSFPSVTSPSRPIFPRLETFDEVVSLELAVEPPPPPPPPHLTNSIATATISSNNQFNHHQLQNPP